MYLIPKEGFLINLDNGNMNNFFKNIYFYSTYIWNNQGSRLLLLRMMKVLHQNFIWQVTSYGTFT